jgi:hypothetical protein
MNMNTRVGAVAGVFVALVVVAGCGGERTDRACTMIAVESGVGLQVSDPEPGVDYRLCAGSACDTESTKSQPYSSVGVTLDVPLPDSVGTARMPVRFTTTRGATVVVDDRTTVTLKKYEPNGPHCGTAYQAGVEYRPGSGLVENE